MRNVFLIPVFNERKHINSFFKYLLKIKNEDDILLFVDDGSTDGTFEFFEKRNEKNVIILKRSFNKGLGKTLKTGFNFIIKNFKNVNYIITLDGDNQLSLKNIKKYLKKAADEKIDFMLIKRNLKKYPFYKRAGNFFMSLWVSFLTGFSFKDVETGFRIIKYSALKKINRYFIGVKYSCAQELAVISVKIGLKIDNSLKCDINYYKSNTSVIDALINVCFSFFTYIRLEFRRNL